MNALEKLSRRRTICIQTYTSLVDWHVCVGNLPDTVSRAWSDFFKAAPADWAILKDDVSPRATVHEIMGLETAITFIKQDAA